MDPNFMGLPSELRVMIYELCLPIDEELVLKPTACENEDIAAGDLEAAPIPALLQVNKITRAEAAAVFFGKNTWRIIDIPEGLQLPSFFSTFVRKATVTFDRRIFKIDDLWDFSDEVFDDRVRAGWRLGEIHDRVKDYLLDIWIEKCTALGNLCLKELTVDFAHCKCPLGCCRMVEDILEDLTEYATLEGNRKIIATGMVFEHESQVIHRRDILCVQCHKGPEELAAAAGYCWGSLLDEEY